MGTPTTLIWGGSGKCAKHITKLLTADGQKVYSVIRNPTHSPTITALGATPILQSIESASLADMTQTLLATNPSTIIWAAGAGAGNAERTNAVDRDGAIRGMDAVAAAGVGKRFIIISALDVRDREGRGVPEWYDEGDLERSGGVWKAIGPYMHAKFAADKSLVTENSRRGLEYTIVRPGGLSEAPATGKIAAGKVHINTTISREDVAAVVVECMKQKDTVGLAIDVVGGETSISEAIAKVARERIDTFEGRY